MWGEENEEKIENKERKEGQCFELIIAQNTQKLQYTPV